MTKPFSKIPIEPSIQKIRLFSSNTSKFDTASTHCTSAPTTLASLTGFTRSPHRTSTQVILPKCKCPHILAADDDPFETFYYECLFKKPTSLQDLTIQNDDKIKVRTYSSGEDLTACYQMYEKCGCRSISLIITDYNMGEKKMNGVETALLLRNTGYKGHIVLRSSDKQEDLLKREGKLEELLQTKVITYLLDKTDSGMTKEILQKLRKNMGI